jgi:single-strand DNA-binding protein|tara:strand:- start:265 stop:690 length:426 start_codon:yes stop_codon:yes gene_type:complete
MNIIHLSGNLTKNPESRDVNIGERSTTVVNFTVASSRKFKKKDGTLDEETTFVNCEAWDSGAETICKWFEKGDSIIVHGSLKNDKWEDKEGNMRYREKVRVSTFEFPPKGKQKKQDESTTTSESSGDFSSKENVPEEALPF